MKILQSVVVKQVLTEKSKKELLNKFEKNLFQLRKECEQLQFEKKRLEKSNKYLQQDLSMKFESEIKKRMEKVETISIQLDQLNLLPLGSEVKEQEVQALVDIHVGDQWKHTNQAEIVIKDGVVLEIR
jgi:hypothetical protein